LLKTAKRIPGIYLSSVWVVLLASAWVLFWSFGVVCSLSVQFAPLIILALLVNLAYTLETLRNVVCAITAKRVATIYLGQPSSLSMMQALRAAFVTWFGSICMGSLFVPILQILRVMVSECEILIIASWMELSFPISLLKWGTGFHFCAWSPKSTRMNPQY
jgi:hypothetical protein